MAGISVNSGSWIKSRASRSKPSLAGHPLDAIFGSKYSQRQYNTQRVRFISSFTILLRVGEYRTDVRFCTCARSRWHIGLSKNFLEFRYKKTSIEASMNGVGALPRMDIERVSCPRVGLAAGSILYRICQLSSLSLRHDYDDAYTLY